MTRYPYVLTLAFAAAPLFAQQAPPADVSPAPPVPPPAPMAVTTTSAPARVAVPKVVDSPLVAAAKRANRGATPKSKIVITNDTLKKTGGHMTTTNTPPPMPTVAATAPQTPPSQADILRHQQEVEAKKAAAAQQRQQREGAARAVADYYGESLEPRAVDPAQVERNMQQSVTTTTSSPQVVEPTSKPPM